VCLELEFESSVETGWRQVRQARLNDGEVGVDDPGDLPSGLVADDFELPPNRCNRLHDVVSLVTAQHKFPVRHFSSAVNCPDMLQRVEFPKEGSV